MKVSSILFLQPSDLAHFAKVQDRYGGVRRLFIDPGLVEVAVREGVELDPLSFIPPEFDRHLQARVATEASARAAALDLALTRLRREVFGEGSFHGWDQGLLRQFFLRGTLFRELGLLCDAQFAPGPIGILRPQNPQLFYFDSFVTPDMFAATSSRWQVVESYETAALWRSDAYSRVFDIAAVKALALRGIDCVTHLPATYRHMSECRQQIVDKFSSILDLPSEFWDIAISRSAEFTRPASDLEPESAPLSCSMYRERARSVFERHLADFLPHDLGVRLQADLFARRSFVQAVNFNVLSNGLRGTKPHFVVTDHDTGNNGPIFTVAHGLGASITVIPHSSYVTGVLPHGERVEAIERDGFRTPVRTCLGERVHARGVRLGREVVRRPRTRVRKVCLLLNGMVTNGLFHLDLIGVMQCFAALKAICHEAGADLEVRLKPTASGVALVSGVLGVSVEELERTLQCSIEEVAESSDVCVSFGQPTSGMINFLAAGCFLVHVGRQFWPADAAWAPAFVGDGTVPSCLPDEGLALINEILGDPRAFQIRAERQAFRYQARLSGGGPLFSPSAHGSEPLRVDPGEPRHGIQAFVAEPDPVLWAQAVDAIPRVGSRPLRVGSSLLMQ